MNAPPVCLAQAASLGLPSIADARRYWATWLLRDFIGNTRSWLMVESAPGGGATRLYFGSAIVPRVDPRSGTKKLGASFHVLLGFHKRYSRALLSAARTRLQLTCC